MKKISSKSTYFRKKIIPIIILINMLVFFFCFTVLDFSFKNLSPLFFPTVIFLFAWIYNFRKLEEVYLSNKYLEIKNEKIPFKNIVSINKKSSFCYELTYQINTATEKSILFMVDSLPIYPAPTPDYLKDIKEFIEKEKIGL